MKRRLVRLLVAVVIVLNILLINTFAYSIRSDLTYVAKYATVNIPSLPNVAGCNYWVIWGIENMISGPVNIALSAKPFYFKTPYNLGSNPSVETPIYTYSASVSGGNSIGAWTLTHTYTSSTNDAYIGNGPVLYSNADILTAYGDLVYSSGAFNEHDVALLDDFRADILTPRDGFVQSKLNAISMRLYYHIPYNGVMSDIDIQVHGLKAGSQVVQSHDVTVSADGTEIEGYLNVIGSVPWNVPTELEFWVYDYNDIPYGEYITVTCYDDFLDANADGKDDRSNQDDWTGLDDWDIVVDSGVSNPYPEGGSILDILSWFGSGITSFFSSIGQTFQSLQSFGGEFVGFIGSVFTYIPAPLIAMIGLGIGVVIVLRIFGR